MVGTPSSARRGSADGKIALGLQSQTSVRQAARASRLSCRKAGNMRIHARSRVIWGIPDKTRLPMTSQNPDEARAAANAAAASEFYNLHELVAKARVNLNQNDWDYIGGGTETETTLRRNRLALDSIALRPRVLRDVSKVDPSVGVLGKKLRLPVVLCPVGSLESFHPGGAEPVVRAAGEFGVAHMLSSVCDPGLEE